jgi:PTS system N-acetylgalactosamine-specific IIB component
MPNIVLSRIDERLVHGQVGVQWVGFANANIVVVVDDEVATDSTQQDLMEMVLAEGIAIRFWSVQKTIDNIHKAKDRQKILIVAKSPAIFLKMIQGGVDIKNINVGNMHFTDAKKQIAKTVSVDEMDIKSFNSLKNLNVSVNIQGIPTESAVDIFSLLNK